MNRKLQVFISSTYLDLKEERQAAVQAVLAAGHIPAGMELFSAGDDSQLKVIKRWIDDSDVYMLILGARYGSIEATTRKSYTHVEYEYAVAQGKRVFAVYLDDKPFDERVKELAGQLANEDRKGYAEFRGLVKSKMCAPFSDTKDITIAVLMAFNDFAHDPALQRAGWVRVRDVPDTTSVLSENAHLGADVVRLNAEVARLAAENHALQGVATAAVAAPAESLFGGYTFRQVVATLRTHRPGAAAPAGVLTGEADPPGSALDYFISNQNALLEGLDPNQISDSVHGFLIGHVAPRLGVFGLVTNRHTDLTDDGRAFIARWAVENATT